MPLPSLFFLKICQQNRQHHKLFSLITAAGQKESSPPLHFRRFFASNIPPDNEFGTTTEGSSSAKQKHVKPKLNEQEQGPLMPTSQVLQMSEKLIQLALTATNLANELIQRNCCAEGRPTDHQQIANHRTAMGVWQCANCKRDNGKLNDVCFKCGAEKSVGMPKMAKRKNATKKGAASETEDWKSSYEEVGQHLKKSRIATLALDETAGKNWMRDNFFDTEFAKPNEAVVAEAQKTVTAVEEEEPISAKNESDDNKPNEAVVIEAQKTVEAVEEQPISAKNESDGKLGAVFLAGSTEEK
uniref:RanBP2-type domain-containing protein n=1 Tax=Globodera pallida TaxID=36090 RepID=A0A183BI30_GLOPA